MLRVCVCCWTVLCSHISACPPYQRARSHRLHLKQLTPQILDSAVAGHKTHTTLHVTVDGLKGMRKAQIDTHTHTLTDTNTNTVKLGFSTGTALYTVCMVWKSMLHYSYALGALTAALRVEILYWSPSQRTRCQHRVSGEAAENFTVSTTCHFDIKSYLKRHGRVVRKQSFSHRSVMFTPALRMWAFPAIFSWITGVATQRKPSYQCRWRRRRSQSLCARLHIQRQTETTPDFCHFS